VPDQTQIHFELGATLHSVEGTLRLVRGDLHFDTASGRADGSIAIDARSAETGNARRDRTLHAEVLESERYPEIVFTAERIELTRSAPERGDVVLSGRVKLHGDEHPLSIPAHLERVDDDIRVTATFKIPYVAWGLRNVSNWVLHVDDEVVVHVDATASYRPDASTGGASADPPSAARTE
jgi:polyisoprenoid-binding protein YceI